MLKIKYKATVSMLNVKARDSTIKKRWNKCGLFGTFAKRRPSLSKKNVAAQLRVAKLHLNNHRSSGTILWTDENNVEMFGHNAECDIWQKTSACKPPCCKEKWTKIPPQRCDRFQVIAAKGGSTSC